MTPATTPQPPPSRPEDPVERRRVLLDEVLASTRLRTTSNSATLLWLIIVLAYLPIGLCALVARLCLFITYVVIASTVLPQRFGGWLAAHCVFPLLGWRIAVTGLEHLQSAVEQRSFFIMAVNHVFYADSAMISRLLRRVGPGNYTLLASTLQGGEGQWELLKKLGIVKDTVYTKSAASTPEEAEATRQTLLALPERSQETSIAQPLLIFPEGQVHNCDRYLLRYEQFCFGLDAPVLPVAARLRCVWPINLWVPADNPAVTWALLFFIPSICWEYSVLPLTTAEAGEPSHAFAQRVQQATAECLGIQPTDFTLRDVSEVLDYLWNKDNTGRGP